jgi:hypothetical protein
MQSYKTSWIYHVNQSQAVNEPLLYTQKWSTLTRLLPINKISQTKDKFLSKKFLVDNIINKLQVKL